MNLDYILSRLIEVFGNNECQNGETWYNEMQFTYEMLEQSPLDPPLEVGERIPLRFGHYCVVSQIQDSPELRQKRYRFAYQAPLIVNYPRINSWASCFND